jgi:hypothetical protein
MWPCEQVKLVEEGSWMLCGTKKNTGEVEQLLASGGATWQLRATAARRGGAARSQQGSGERWAGDLEGQVVRLKRGGGAGGRR